MTSEQLVERLFLTTIGALELLSVHIGHRLGLYETLHTTGACTPHDLASRAVSTSGTRASGSSSRPSPA